MLMEAPSNFDTSVYNLFQTTDYTYSSILLITISFHHSLSFHNFNKIYFNDSASEAFYFVTKYFNSPIHRFWQANKIETKSEFLGNLLVMNEKYRRVNKSHALAYVAPSLKKFRNLNKAVPSYQVCDSSIIIITRV